MTDTYSEVDGAAVTHLTIGGVERDTGLSKDVLRVWERRYAFPRPERDRYGERLYPLSQVERLRTIKRLMDAGHRPGKLLAMNEVALSELSSRQFRSQHTEQVANHLQQILTLLRTNDDIALRQFLAQLMMKQGLQRFVLETLSPLNREIGDAWIRGELQVFHEHAYTQVVQTSLRAAISTIPLPGSSPRIVLTTFPNEPHSLGLLLVEALLVPEGAHCISLGPQTPIPEIAAATAAYDAHVVALSFSSAYGGKQALTGLASLRELLPPHVAIWVGGALFSRLRTRLPGIDYVENLAATLSALKQWRNGTAQ
ncbi:MAG: MerR family transcriptional regulator [Betaproteobacteria bacterium]|nr:MAG: MerR family transcriptional regulator [Betaproteobacteria bacterium]TAG46834.1 MAG: MerR family transcriptional regulator [Betaproteobacteria bacterium]